ncbi:MAG: NAD-dependent epimerase/dehydratase family protein [Luteibacter sp.]
MTHPAKSIFIIGATGFVGGAMAGHLAGLGHDVLGLARSTGAHERLGALGLRAVSGDLEGSLGPVLAAATGADTVIFAAQVPPEIEHRAVSALLDALAGSRKTFIFISGTGVFLQRTGGAWSPDSYAEDEPFPVEPLATRRVEVETLVREAASRGVRSIVIRPPLLWGPDDHGHVAMTYRSVAVTGAACYVGSGLATYSHLHVDDLAVLVALADERGGAGALYHGVAGEVPNRWIAEAVAHDMGCATRSLSMKEAVEVWGEFGALIMSASSRSRSHRTSRELGWAPTHTDMLTMIGEPRLRAMAVAHH